MPNPKPTFQRIEEFLDGETVMNASELVFGPFSGRKQAMRFKEESQETITDWESYGAGLKQINGKWFVIVRRGGDE